MHASGRRLAQAVLSFTLPALVVSLGPAFSDAGIEAQEEATLVYLVRHSEKEAEPADDPPLTPEGRGRAQFLANLLKHSGLTHIHSTPFVRTRRTARPVADSTGLEILEYNPLNLEGMANFLKETPGRHLVVGHSDTTPALVEMLGGDPGEPIDEATEYDRLYLLVLHADGDVSTILLRSLKSESGG